MGQDNYKIYSFALAGSSALCEFFFHTHVILLCLIKYFIKKKLFLLCICFILPTILKTIFSQIMYLFMYNIYTPTSDLGSRSWTSITHLRDEWDGITGETTNKENSQIGTSPVIQWHPAPVFLSRESHGQRSLVGYSPWADWSHLARTPEASLLSLQGSPSRWACVAVLCEGTPGISHSSSKDTSPSG